jgi:hypothetical protein
MRTEHRILWHLLVALCCGIIVTGIYDGLLFTHLSSSVFHSIAAKALSPATDFVHNLDPCCYEHPLACYIEALAANPLLYTFWIFTFLVCADFLVRVKRRLSRSH